MCNLLHTFSSEQWDCITDKCPSVCLSPFLFSLLWVWTFAICKYCLLEGTRRLARLSSVCRVTGSLVIWSCLLKWQRKIQWTLWECYCCGANSSPGTQAQSTSTSLRNVHVFLWPFIAKVIRLDMLNAHWNFFFLKGILDSRHILNVENPLYSISSAIETHRTLTQTNVLFSILSKSKKHVPHFIKKKRLGFVGIMIFNIRVLSCFQLSCANYIFHWFIEAILWVRPNWMCSWFFTLFWKSGW